MKPKIFIDGSEGTTGLQIHDRLKSRNDIELLQVAQAKRKDINERKKLINAADLIFLCLPDDAAREAVSLIENDNTRVIDASTAHRISDDWVYGLSELSPMQKDSIKKAKRVSNPGCHSTGVILLLAPAISAGFVPAEYPVAITSVTGYTGGGKSMISLYETPGTLLTSELNAPRLYATSASHKHIPEITKYTGLKTTPVLIPIVADYPQGIQVIIPLDLPGAREEIFKTLQTHYRNFQNIEVLSESPAFAASNINAQSDKITLKVLGFDNKIILTAQFDNLGKGASGAAVQNMNIMLGFNEYEGLLIEGK
ncbi:MAG: N-acetyl-gamma-glutamyl-phosphate reductase [Oscillospiraceae bacterium]|nr:N-acetyl-gamma-glutamyl-phosphate reductase [Oscillospiraceae bacterium]